MSMSDYLAELQATKTYKAGLITTQEYKFITKFLGTYRALPDIPHADADKHIIVMELRGGQPNMSIVLTDPNPKITINPNTTDADKLLFIFVKMKPQTLKVASPPEKYYIGGEERHQIEATFDLTYRVADAEELWKGAVDPLAMLEAEIVNEAKNYFLSIESKYLITSPGDLKDSLEQRIQDTGVRVIKDNLENNIREKCVISGIEIMKVFADVQLSVELNDYFKRIIKERYGEGGHLDQRRSEDKIFENREYINRRIKNDETFQPYALRDVIMKLDTGLVENFHTMNWNDAMRKVHDELARQKKEYLEQIREQGNADIDRITKLIRKAEEAGLEEMQILPLKDSLAEKMLESIENSDSLKNSEFLQWLIGTPSSAGQLTSSTPKQISSPTENSETDKE